MAVVTMPQLRRFMSNPKWSPEQQEAAEELCEQVESSLEDALYGTWITPRPYAESAPILAKTGLVDTRYPVAAVTSIDGATVPADDPLPEGWALDGHRLRRTGGSAGGAVAGTTGVISALTRWPLGNVAATALGESIYSGSVELNYMAGWGAHPTLVRAILRKAAATMQHRHSDVVVAQGLDAAAPPPPAPEEWTTEELAHLGRFRRLGAGGS